MYSRLTNVLLRTQSNFIRSKSFALSTHFESDQNKVEVSNSLEAPSYQILDTIDIRSKPIEKIQPDELEAKIKTSMKPFELFNLLELHHTSFEPEHLVRFARKLSVVTCYDESTNQFATNDYIIPDVIKELFTKKTIKLAPHFDVINSFLYLDKLIILGFNANEDSVKAMLQISKYHINNLDLKGIIRFKSNLDKLALSGTTRELEMLQEGLVLCVQAKKKEIWSIRMKIKFLQMFPKAFTDNETQTIIIDLFPEWQDLLKNQRKALVEIILERNVVNREILKKIKKVLKTYIIETKDYLTIIDSEVTIKEKESFLCLVNSFAETLTKGNYYTEFSFWPDLINSQISVLKTIPAETQNLEIYIKTLSNLLQSCLNFNLYSQDLLQLFFKGNQNSIYSMMPSDGFKRDLLIYYAGICGYEDFRDEDLKGFMDYFETIQNHTDEAYFNCLRGLTWLNRLDSKIDLNKIYQENEPQNYIVQIKSYIFKLIAENSEVYEIVNESKNLADFQINNKLTNQSCLVYIERRNQRFKNTGQLLNSVTFRLQTILGGINSTNNDKTSLWHIKQKTNVPLSFNIDSVQNVLNSEHIYNETFF